MLDFLQTSSDVLRPVTPIEARRQNLEKARKAKASPLLASEKRRKAAAAAALSAIASARRGVVVSRIARKAGSPDYLRFCFAPATARSWGLKAGERVELRAGRGVYGEPVLALRKTETGGYKLLPSRGGHADRVQFTVAPSSLGAVWSGIQQRTDCRYAPRDGWGFVWAAETNTTH